MFGTCSSSDCDKRTHGMTNRCLFHETIENARQLQPRDFDRLMATFATVEPLTDDERAQRRSKALLSRVHWSARDLKRAKKAARDEGVTDGQILDAVRKGKADA